MRVLECCGIELFFKFMKNRAGNITHALSANNGSILCFQNNYVQKVAGCEIVK